MTLIIFYYDINHKREKFYHGAAEIKAPPCGAHRAKEEHVTNAES
jgi:hypothetical protein